MFTSNNKTSLNQGKQFITMQKMFNRVIKNIGKSNYVGIEGASGNDDPTKMDVLTTSFRNTLGEYEAAFTLHLAGAMNDKKGIFQYYDKTVKLENDDDVYWITNKGVKRKLTAPETIDTGNTVDDLVSKLVENHQCKQPRVINKQILELFTKGADLDFIRASDSAETGNEYIWQKCNSPWEHGGHFIQQDGVPSQLGWYDWKGKKHLFKSGLTKDKVHNSFPKKSTSHITHNIPVDEWNLMKDGSPELDENTPRPGISQNNKQPTILQLNNKLIDLAHEMKDHIDMIVNRGDDTDEASKEAQSALEVLIATVKQQRKEIKELKTEIFSLDANITDNKHLVKSINLRYITWGISLITLSLLIMHQINK